MRFQIDRDLPLRSGRAGAAKHYGGAPGDCLSLGRSNELAGATGTLVGDGGGAFVTGGQFVLSLTGDIRTSAAPQNAKFHATVVGTATLPTTCSASNHRISQLRGEGTIRSIGRSVMELDSEILETSCL